MISADTNVWVRYVTNDDQLQAERAVELLGSGEEVFVAKTVLLELAWVLRAVYELPADSIRRAMIHILGLPMVVVEQPEQIALALDYYERGLDFADALHLVASPEECRFHTFDRKFAKAAASLGLPVEEVG
jgi:predicted nucleic-acid-binding protein